jgi:hypothetical protein
MIPPFITRMSNLTKQNIDTMLKRYTATTSLTPKYEKVKAIKMLENMGRLLPAIQSSYGAKKLDQLDKQLQWIKKYAEPKDKVTGAVRQITVPYGNNKGIGRLYPKSACCGYVSITRSVRHYLAGEIATDVDIVNCHPVFIEQMYETLFGEACPYLKRWNTEREDIFKELIRMTELNGGIVDQSNLKRRPMTRDDCKEIAYSFLYSTYPKSIEKLFKSFELPCSGEIYDICNGLTLTSARLIGKLKNDYHDFWVSINGSDEKGNLDGSRFSTLMQHVECFVVRIMKATADRLSFGVDDICHDGLLLNNDNQPLTDDEFMRYKHAVENDILMQSGFTLEITKKSMPMPSWAEMLTENRNVDLQKLLKYVPDTDTLDMNMMKKDRFQDLNDYEIDEVAGMVAGKYFIRVRSDWYSINATTKEILHKFSKHSFKDAAGGSILLNSQDSPNIRIYESIVFQDPDLVRPNEWNCFGELRYDRSLNSLLSQDELEKIDQFLYHIREIVCDGNVPLFAFLMNVWKHKLIKPFEVSRATGIFTLLVGGQGVGKTSAIETFFKLIFGEKYVNTSAPYTEVVSGGFTDAISNKLVVIMNEIPEADASHKRLHETFKAMITDSSRRCRQMYQAGASVPNTIMYIGTSNNRNCYKAEEGDRRTIITEVSRRHKGDTAYFSKLNQCISENYLLIAQYIVGFEYNDADGNSLIPTSIPETKMRIYARELDLCTVGKFLNHALTEQTLKIEEGWTIGRRALYTMIKEFCESEHIRSKPSQVKIKGALFDRYFIDENMNTHTKVKVYALRPGLRDALYKAVCWDGSTEDPSTADDLSLAV